MGEGGSTDELQKNPEHKHQFVQMSSCAYAADVLRTRGRTENRKKRPGVRTILRALPTKKKSLPTM